MHVNKTYIKTNLDSVIEINKIISLHYFQYVKNFFGELENHDFWEFVYVDSGKIKAFAKNTWHELYPGEIIFHQPCESHNIRTESSFASVFIASFECTSSSMDFFVNKILKLKISERELIASLFKEGQKVFQGPFDIMGQRVLIKKKNAAFGAEQLVKLILQELLIQIIRRNTVEVTDNFISENNKQYTSHIVAIINIFLDKHIEENISLAYISDWMSFSKSYLEKIFHEQMGCGIMQQYLKLKIARAKRLISENEYTFTEIAEKLNFNSIHHFSRTFKQQTGMTPSQYQQSVKSRALL